MTHIFLFEKFIEESYLAGSRAPLYHSTNIFAAKEILDEDCIKPDPNADPHFMPKPAGISLTRDRDMVYDNNPITFVIDQDKLREMGRTTQFDYYNKIKSRTKSKDVEFEAEEVFHGEIKPLHRCLVGVRMNNKFDFYRNFRGPSKEEIQESFQDFMESLQRYAAEYKIKLFDRLNKEISPDSLESIRSTKVVY